MRIGKYLKQHISDVLTVRFSGSYSGSWPGQLSTIIRPGASFRLLLWFVFLMLFSDHVSSSSFCRRRPLETRLSSVRISSFPSHNAFSITSLKTGPVYCRTELRLVTTSITVFGTTRLSARCHSSCPCLPRPSLGFLTQIHRSDCLDLNPTSFSGHDAVFTRFSRIGATL